LILETEKRRYRRWSGDGTVLSPFSRKERERNSAKNHADTPLKPTPDALDALLLHGALRKASMARGVIKMTLEIRLMRRIAQAAMLFAAVFLIFAAATAARADHCEDIANQLKSQIDGLKIQFPAANMIYLSHPAAKELSLGCPNRKYANELYAKSDRKPRPEFYQLVGTAAAIVFTLPKDDVMTGTSRCLNRMGILRGDKVNMRFKRLDMECTRTKTEASIAIQRGKD
jgi:hypothetical protein